MNTIGCKICNLRKQNSMSQEQLAEKLNVSRQSVSKWERDEAFPDIFNLEAISDVFNVTIDSIVKKDEHISAAPISTKSTMPFLDKKSIKNNVIVVTCLSAFFFVLALTFCYIGDYCFMEDAFLPNAFLAIVISLIPALIIYRGVLKDKLGRYYPKTEDTVRKNKLIIINSTITHIFISLTVISILQVGLLLRIWLLLPIILLVLTLCAIIVKNIIPAKNEAYSVPQINTKISAKSIIKINNYYKRADILLVASIAFSLACILIYFLYFRYPDSYISSYSIVSANGTLIPVYPNYTPYYILLGVSFIVFISMILFQLVYRKKIKNVYSEDDKPKAEKENYLLNIFSSIALIILLISGFWFKVWHPTWIVLPISGLLVMIINNIRSKKASIQAEEQTEETAVE